MELQDRIGRKEIVDKICFLVDNLQKDKHFCLALNGDWGSGKSFVMQMIEEQLKQKKENTVIKYDAWANNYYSDPLISILSCVIDGVQEKLSEMEGDLAVAKELGEKIKEKALQDKGLIGMLARAIQGIAELMKKFNEPFSTDNQEIIGLRSYQKLLIDVKEKLNSITEFEEYEGKQNKLIILVDEIDRCLPDEQLKILERLHHLFDINNCVVICAVNKNCIIKNVQVTYGTDGNEYLRKFFDFNYKLETKAATYLESLLRDYYNSLKSVNNQAGNDAVESAYYCLLYSSEKVLEKTDNRELYRYFELVKKVSEEFGWDKLTPHYVFFIIIALYIRKNRSSTFLRKDYLLNNQREYSAQARRNDYAEYGYEMPYYDYIYEELGIDRKDLPEKIGTIYRNRNCYIPEYSWCFNEIIYFSLDKEFNGNAMRVFNHQPTVRAEDCRKLRELIIKYGGEKD